jgi:hypothetical protein
MKGFHKGIFLNSASFANNFAFSALKDITAKEAEVIAEDAKDDFFYYSTCHVNKAIPFCTPSAQYPYYKT